MSAITQYNPQPMSGSWHNCSIDKISICMKHEYLNSAVKDLYRQGHITLLEHGNHAFICFHAECLSPHWPLLHQIAFHLYELARHGVFIEPIRATIMGTIEMVNYPAFQYNQGLVLDRLSQLFSISEIEIAFDFEGIPPWIIMNHWNFIHVDTTLYSKRDYKKKYRKNLHGTFVKNGQSKSLVSMYDHAACHGYEGSVTRFELRFCGSYAEKWNFLKLVYPFETFLGRYCNQIAGSLKKAMSPKDIQFDLDRIKDSHPLLYPILNRWASWGYMGKAVA